MNKFTSSERTALLGGFALGLGIATVWYRWEKNETSHIRDIIQGKKTPPVALIIIDMQKGFDDEKFWGGEIKSRNNPECEKNILFLLQKWREKHWPIFHVRHLSLEENSPLNPYTGNGEGYEWKKWFEPLKNEKEIVKNVNSAFIGTTLKQQLKQLKNPPLVLCGLTANHCVNTTARMGGNLGFQVFVPFDCTAAFPRSTFEKDRIVSAQEVCEVALSNTHREFCCVTSMRKILEWIENKWPSVAFEDGVETLTSPSSSSTASISSSFSSSVATSLGSPSSSPSFFPSSLIGEDEKNPLSSLSLFEHINLNVTDLNIAEDFYVQGLGFCLNPATTNERQVHVNMGLSQLHLPYKLTIINKEPVTTPQQWKGRILLVTEENLSVVCERVLKHKAESATLISSSPPSLRVVCPYGNTYIFTQSTASEKTSLLNFKGHPGGTGSVIALSGAVHLCPPGSAQKIAQFYREILGCRAQLLPLQSTSGKTSALFACKITFRLTNGAATQFLVFEENEISPAYDDYDKEEAAAYHVCFYFHTQEAYETSLRRAAAANLLYVNPRFQGGPHEFSSAHSVEEGLSIGQYRVKDLGGGLILEHEIRSPHHTACPLGPRE